MATLDFGGVRPGTFGPDITQYIPFNDLPSFADGILEDIPARVGWVERSETAIACSTAAIGVACKPV